MIDVIMNTNPPRSITIIHAYVGVFTGSHGRFYLSHFAFVRLRVYINPSTVYLANGKGTSHTGVNDNLGDCNHRM